VSEATTGIGDVEATCREVIGFLADYLGGELEPGRREAFEEHLAECPSCVSYVASYRATIELARGSAEAAPPLPEAVARRLADAIRAARGG
jgi:anti-sigma factor RsiW